MTIEDLVGSWSATSLSFTNNANSSETFDWIAAGGENRFTVLEGGRTRVWADLGTLHDEWDGMATIDSGDMTLTLTPAESVRPVEHYSFSLNGNTLTLTNNDSTFDFTLSGEPGISATMSGVYTRTGQ